MTVPSSDTEKVLDTEFQAPGVDVLKLKVPEGSMRLRSHEENRVHVRGFVPTATFDPEQDRPDPQAVSTHQSDDCLHIFRQGLSTDVSAWRRRRRHRTTIHLDIRLPPRLDVSAETPGGAIDAAQLGGALDFTVRGGTVHLEHVSGPLRLRGNGGPLTVQNASGSSVDVQWAAGPVTLDQILDAQTTLLARSASTTVQGHRGPLDLTVHGAPLTLTDLEGPCEAEVRGNNLTYRGAPTGDTVLRAVGGEIQMHLPSTLAVSLSLIGARVDLDEDFAFDGETTPHRIEGTLNGGGPELMLRAIQGTASCHVQE